MFTGIFHIIQCALETKYETICIEFTFYDEILEWRPSITIVKSNIQTERGREKKQN